MNQNITVDETGIFDTEAMAYVYELSYKHEEKGLIKKKYYMDSSHLKLPKHSKESQDIYLKNIDSMINHFRDNYC